MQRATHGKEPSRVKRANVKKKSVRIKRNF